MIVFLHFVVSECKVDKDISVFSNPTTTVEFQEARIESCKKTKVKNFFEKSEKIQMKDFTMSVSS